MLAACARAGSESATGAAAGPSPGTAGAARIDRKRSPAVGRGGSTVVQRRWCRAGGRAAATRRRCLARDPDPDDTGAPQILTGERAVTTMRAFTLGLP